MAILLKEKEGRVRGKTTEFSKLKYNQIDFMTQNRKAQSNLQRSYLKKECLLSFVGRWWITGSSSLSRCESESQAAGSVQRDNSKLLELARKQRMNTDVRKNVFLVIMTSEVSKLNWHFYVTCKKLVLLFHCYVILPQRIAVQDPV